MPKFSDIRDALQRYPSFHVEVAEADILDPNTVIWRRMEDGSLVTIEKGSDRAIQAREIGGGLLRFSVFKGSIDPIVFGASAGGSIGGFLFRSRSGVVLGAMTGAALGVISALKDRHAKVISMKRVAGRWAIVEGSYHESTRVLRALPQ